VDVPTLQAKAATAAESTHVTAVLAAESSAQEAAMVWDSAVVCVKDIEDRVTLAEREACEKVLRVETENTMMLAFAHEDAEGLVWKIALLRGELAEARRAWEVAEEKSRGLSDAAVDAKRRWEVYKKGPLEHFEELTLLQTRGSEVCLTIVGPPWLRNHLSEGMHIAALCRTEMVGKLAVLQATVSSTMELALGHSPDETFRVEVVGELVAEFQKLEEQCSWLERRGTSICDLLLGSPPGQAWLADHLEEATG
jgi:hypothetical protein